MKGSKNISLLVVLLAFVFIAGGFAYRAYIERKSEVIACPLDAKVCPDGTTLGRTGPACTFAECPPPNIALESLGIAFVLPSGYTALAPDDSGVVAAYRRDGIASTTESSEIRIRRFSLTGSTTPFEVVRETAIQDGSGLPAPGTAFRSVSLGNRTFTAVEVGRFEAIVATAYYLEWGNEVLRFDAVDHGVLEWMNPDLDISVLPAHRDLRALLTTLQGR